MILLVRDGFGLNTNLFETNVLNLVVVLRVVVVVVGDALRTLLDQRRQTILSTLQEASKKAREAQQQLENAQKAVETAQLRAQEIRIKMVQVVEQENYAIQQQLNEDLRRLQERGRQAIQLERQRTVQIIAQQVANLALVTAENTLLETLRSYGTAFSKQTELNELHVRETFRKLKR